MKKHHHGRQIYTSTHNIHTEAAPAHSLYSPPPPHSTLKFTHAYTHTHNSRPTKTNHRTALWSLRTTPSPTSNACTPTPSSVVSPPSAQPVYPTLPYFTLLYPTLPYLTTPYPTLPYPTLPYCSAPARSAHALQLLHACTVSNANTRICALACTQSVRS